MAKERTAKYEELKTLIEKRGVHAEFGDAGEGFAIEQNPHELATFLTRMQELGVQSVLEIGTGYKGGLSRFLASDLQWDVTTYDIKNYGHVFTGVHYIVGGQPTITDSFDLVFIDGDHSYESVKADYADYGKRAVKVIAFHDALGLRGCEGVNQFWEEIALEDNERGLLKPNHYFVIDGKGNRSGIGWIEL